MNPSKSVSYTAPAPSDPRYPLPNWRSAPATMQAMNQRAGLQLPLVYEQGARKWPAQLPVLQLPHELGPVPQPRPQFATQEVCVEAVRMQQRGQMPFRVGEGTAALQNGQLEQIRRQVVAQQRQIEQHLFERQQLVMLPGHGLQQGEHQKKLQGRLGQSGQEQLQTPQIEHFEQQKQLAPLSQLQPLPGSDGGQQFLVQQGQVGVEQLCAVAQYGQGYERDQIAQEPGTAGQDQAVVANSNPKPARPAEDEVAAQNRPVSNINEPQQPRAKAARKRKQTRKQPTRQKKRRQSAPAQLAAGAASPTLSGQKGRNASLPVTPLATPPPAPSPSPAETMLTAGSPGPSSATDGEELDGACEALAEGSDARSVVSQPDSCEQAGGGRQYACTHCVAEFGTREERRLHVRMEHARRFQCLVCKSGFTRRFDLEKHALTVHEGRRPFVCEFCLSSFGQKHHMTRHMRAVHKKVREFECESCSMRFARKEHLFNHRRAVHKVRGMFCVLCEGQFCEKRALKRHLEDVHHVKANRAGMLAAWQPGGKGGAPDIEELVKI